MDAPKTRGAVVVVLVSMAVCGLAPADVSWIPGESGPPVWSIETACLSTFNMIHFSGPTAVFGNDCSAEVSAGGTPTLTIDRVNKTVGLWFRPPPPLFCPNLWQPVCGLQGAFGPLEAGEWLFFGNNPYADFSIVFEVSEPAAVYYVDADAPGAGTGSSWANAYNNLQEALYDANLAGVPVEIRVGQGTYRPTEGAVNVPPCCESEVSFQLINCVVVKGGYAGYGEPDPNARNIILYETILSGDLDGNDTPVSEPCDLLEEPTRAENSWNVVSGHDTNDTAVLDGFTIRGGNMHVICEFAPCGGGGMHNNGGSPTVMNCTFTENAVLQTGGGMYNQNNSNPMIINCMFTRNAAGNGGGIYGGSPAITCCTFSDNHAYGGGALFNCGGPITNCIMLDNSAEQGGGIVYEGCDATLTNCLFARNSANEGGAISCALDGNSTFMNCTIVQNSASLNAGGIFVGPGSDMMITNSIIWQNSAEVGAQIYLFGGSVCIAYSDVEGGYAGEGNISADPLFVDVDGGDHHLLPGSPCVDAGDPCYVGEPDETDLDGNPRIVSGMVDMGAREFQGDLYVDDDAPIDPGPGDPDVSDPNENGTESHPFDSIQEAIDVAQDGYTVHVLPGSYLEPDPWDPESINFLGKNIKVTSAEPGDWDIVKSTVIRGIVLFEGSEDANCIFAGFTVRDISNGAIYGNHTRATISHCIISGNGPCGATVMENCDGIISNCLITDNLTIYYCGVYPAVMGCHGVIKNCTIANNASGIGIVDGGETTIENCIIYDNGDPNTFEPQILVGSGGILNISYSDLEGGSPGISSDGTVNWGSGNIEADPCFVRWGCWDYEPWPWELTEGDYHLKSEGWRLSEYGPWWVYDDVTSRSIDWGNPGCPLGAELMSIPRDPDNMYGVNVRVNMGAYGGTAEASMAPPGWVLLSDLDNDGATTPLDLGRQVEDWLRCESDLPGDLNRDGWVNITDYTMLASEWEPGEDVTPPMPNPMQWDMSLDANGLNGRPREVWLGPDPTWDYAATMRADPNTFDWSGFEFYFQCTGDSRFDSGWISFPDGPPYTYTVKVGLKGQILYFRVKARDLSPNHNETAWSQTLPMYIPW